MTNYIAFILMDDPAITMHDSPIFIRKPQSFAGGGSLAGSNGIDINDETN